MTCLCLGLSLQLCPFYLKGSALIERTTFIAFEFIQNIQMSSPVNLCGPCRAETMGTGLAKWRGLVHAELNVSRLYNMMRRLWAAQTFTHVCTVSVNVCVFDIRVLYCHSPLESKASHSQALLLPGYPPTSRFRLVLSAYLTHVNLKRGPDFLRCFCGTVRFNTCWLLGQRGTFNWGFCEQNLDIYTLEHKCCSEGYRMGA